MNNLRAFQELAERSGSELLVVIIPTREQVDPALPRAPTIDLERPNHVLREFLEQEGIRYLDLLPAFRQAARSTSAETRRGTELYWVSNGHFNSAGNRLAALLVARRILNSQLLRLASPADKRKTIDNMLKEF